MGANPLKEEDPDVVRFRGVFTFSSINESASFGAAGAGAGSVDAAVPAPFFPAAVAEATVFEIGAEAVGFSALSEAALLEEAVFLGPADFGTEAFSEVALEVELRVGRVAIQESL